MKGTIKNTCRICKLQSPEVVISVEDVREMIEKIIGAKLILLPTQPLNICDSCNNQIVEFLTFRQLCLQSEVELGNCHIEDEYENYEVVDFAEVLKSKPSKKIVAPETREVACQVSEYFCDICKKSFNLANTYNAHMTRIHRIYKYSTVGEATEPGEIQLPKLSKEPGNLRRSQRQNTSSKRVKIIEPVDITFVKREEMEQGKLGENEFQCWKCSKKFELENSYRAHMNRAHNVYVYQKWSPIHEFKRRFPKSRRRVKIKDEDLNDDELSQDLDDFDEKKYDPDLVDELDPVNGDLEDVEIVQNDDGAIILDEDTEVIEMIDEDNPVESEDQYITLGHEEDFGDDSSRIKVENESYPDEILSETPDPQPPQPKIVAVKCRLCSKIYTRRDTFLKHINSSHIPILSKMDPKLKTMLEMRLTEDEYENEMKKSESDKKTDVAFQHYCCQCSFNDQAFGKIYQHFSECHPNQGRDGSKGKKVDTDTTCRICFKTFANYEEKQRHLNKFRPCLGRYVCHVCFNSYETSNSYGVHMRSKHKIYRADQLHEDVEPQQLEEKEENSMVVEMLEEAHEQFDYQTSNGEYPGTADDENEPSHETKPENLRPLYKKKVYRCCQCEFFSLTKVMTYNHFLEKHGHLRKQKDKSFYSADKNRQASGRNICKWCLEQFDSHGEMIRHTIRSDRTDKYEDQGPVICDHCEKIFKSKLRLVQHFHRVFKPKHLICEECGKDFRHPNNLSSHFLRRHRPFLRPYECKICGSTFKSIHDLRRHMQRHTGVKPFQCEFCSKQFFDRSDWVRHQVVHTGVYLYNCSIPGCKKGFQRKKLLVEHMEAYHASQEK